MNNALSTLTFRILPLILLLIVVKFGLRLLSLHKHWVIAEQIMSVGFIRVMQMNLLIQ